MKGKQFVCAPEIADRWAKACTEAGFNVEQFKSSQAAINFVERHCGPISGENPTYFGENLGGIAERNGVCLGVDIWQGQQWKSRQPEHLCWCGVSFIPNPSMWASRSQRCELRSLCELFESIGFKPIDGQDSMSNAED